MADRWAQFANEIADAVRAQVGVQLQQLVDSGVEPDHLDIAAIADRVATHAAAIVASALDPTVDSPSRLADRIGAVYTVEDLARWLSLPDVAALTGRVVGELAQSRQLVAFVTDDDRWAFPAWQFIKVGGQFVLRDEVVTLWQRLPASGFLTDVDLAAWLATPLADLDDTPPAEYAQRHGSDAPSLQQAVGRLRSRAT